MEGDTTTSIVIGIDIGTSGTKAVAVDTAGKVVGSATVGYQMDVPASGWAEQHPRDWWLATVQAVSTLMTDLAGGDATLKTAAAARGPYRVECIGLSGQMHGLVALDGHGEVIRPAIIWCDLRSTQQAQWIEDTVGRKRVLEWTYNPPLPNFTATKLLWMRNHEPESYHKIAAIIQPKDYVRYRMTGSLAAETTDASGTLLFDVASRKWSEDMCAALAIQRGWLPECYEPTDIVGRVTPEAARALCVPEGTPVVAGAGDQAAGAVGLGAIDSGVTSVVFGTSGVVLVPTAQPIGDALGRVHTFCHVLPDRWFAMGVTQAAGGSLQWYRNQFAQSEKAVAQLAGVDSYDLLMDEAAQVPPGADGLVYLPYILGERTPHLNPNARGSFVGLDWNHGPAHMVRSILEGVSFSLRDAWEVLREMGVPLEETRVSGGGAKSRLWMDVFAAVLNRPVDVVGGQEGPAYGAALLAAHGVGIVDLRNATQRQVYLPETRRVVPQTEWAEHYSGLYDTFREVYTSLTGIFDRLADQRVYSNESNGNGKLRP